MMAKKPIPASSRKNLSESSRTTFHCSSQSLPRMGAHWGRTGSVETRNSHMVSTRLDPLFSRTHHAEHGTDPEY